MEYDKDVDDLFREVLGDHLSSLPEEVPNKYAIIFFEVKDQKLYTKHLITVDEEPTQTDIISFYEELDTDEEFDLVGRAKELSYYVLKNF